MIKNKQERTRFLKFCAVGLIGAVVDFGFFNLFTIVFNMSVEISQAISFILAVINNFLWNRYWTYPDSRSKPLSRQLLQFFVVNLVGLGIRAILVPNMTKVFQSMLEKIQFEFFISDQIISQNLALVVGVLVVLLWNYFINRYWTYSDVDKKSDDHQLTSENKQMET